MSQTATMAALLMAIMIFSGSPSTVSYEVDFESLSGMGLWNHTQSAIPLISLGNHAHAIYRDFFQL